MYRPPFLYRPINPHFFLLSVIGPIKKCGVYFKPINNALFPSETLQMCAVRHDGFEMLEV